jgi:hypothetical protein
VEREPVRVIAKGQSVVPGVCRIDAAVGRAVAIAREHRESAGRNHDASVDRDTAIVLRAKCPAAEIDGALLQVVQLQPFASVVRHRARVCHYFVDGNPWRYARTSTGRDGPRLPLTCDDCERQRDKDA